MESAQLHPSEVTRLTALKDLNILDTEDERAFDELTELASTICGCPISLISLIDENRQWFKSRVGLGATETPRSLAFCAHAILQENIFEVPNALEDPRFFDNPLVTGDPAIRFYAGAPLISAEGLPLGTLCVIDREPKHLTEQQRTALKTLANQVVGQLRLRKHLQELEKINRERESFYAMVAHDLRSPFNTILGFAKRLNEKSEQLTPEKISTSAKNILTSAQKLYQLLDELLQWSQQRLGNYKNEPQWQPLLPLIQQTQQLVADQLLLKNQRLKIHCPDNSTIFADAILTKTIIRNLLANAIKFTPDAGNIDIYVEQNQAWTTITVADSGPGIDAKIAEQLFTQNVESAFGTQGESGIGIGLALCREFADRIGATLTVDPQTTQGARIIFNVPSVSPL